jgi:farnesyl-diphosphate farnesyltransferase
MADRAPFETCWRLLPEVSRSFALVIRSLPRPLNDAVMVSYLLCRIADTIEDARRPAADRRRRLADFAGSLESGRPDLPTDGFPAAYRGLLARADDVLACHRSLPPAARGLIAGRVREMCEGMALCCDRRIETFRDQDEYCYYVAGVVGRLLTDLFHAYGHVDASQRAELHRHAVGFGLALQKVNILRDVRNDLEDGRCYWPQATLSRHGLSREDLLHPSSVPRALRAMDELIDDLWPHLESAVLYITILPMTQLRVRIFCAIPLFMAVATVGRCRGNADVFLNGRSVKIARRVVKSIVLRSLSMGPFNRYLHSWYRRWVGRIIARPPRLLMSGSEPR